MNRPKLSAYMSDRVERLLKLKDEPDLLFDKKDMVLPDIIPDIKSLEKVVHEREAPNRKSIEDMAKKFKQDSILS